MRYALILLALGSAGLAMPVAADSACVARSSAETVPLVELYTSEGCSSCPPADRWLSRRIGDDAANFLAFHVDYWDQIGWPDRFGSPAYSQRQRERVGAVGGSTVYTPQVMVGEQVRANWRSGRAWQRTLQQARQPARAALTLRLRPADTGWQVAVGAAARDASDEGDTGAGAQLWLARYVDAQTTQVQAGENRGVTLHHDRVVRGLSGPWPLAAGPVSQRVALSAETAPWGVTAFVQDARGQILQSLSLAAAACSATIAGGR